MSPFEEDHNAEAAAVWKAFHAGDPIRPPVFIGTNTQYFIFNEDLNPGERVTFEAYTTDAQVMFDFQLSAAAWRAENVAPCCDDPVGIPERYKVRVDLQNFDEAAYFGAPVIFLEHQVPDTRPILAGDRKHALFDTGLPHPLTGGWYENAHRLYAEMMGLIEQRPTFCGRPIGMGPFGLWTCGPLTLAHQLRGFELLTDFYEDPDYVHQLLDYVVEGTIARIHAHREFFGLPKMSTDLFFAEDDLQLISLEMMKCFVLPALKKLKAGLTAAERVKVHCCGHAQRHFKTLRDEIGCYEFDTGFPIDFGRLRKELGSQALIWGGPSIMNLQSGTRDEVHTETKRILDSGVCEGGQFILREGNNLAPYTPIANLATMYEAAQAHQY